MRVALQFYRLQNAELVHSPCAGPRLGTVALLPAHLSATAAMTPREGRYGLLNGKPNIRVSLTHDS